MMVLNLRGGIIVADDMYPDHHIRSDHILKDKTDFEDLLVTSAEMSLWHHPNLLVVTNLQSKSTS